MNISQHNDNIQITITRTKLMNMGLPSHTHAVCFQSPMYITQGITTQGWRDFVVTKNKVSTD